MAFNGLSTALTGLSAHQRLVDLHAHNVANAATPGYSRQRLELTSQGPGQAGGIFSRANEIGAGVRTGSISRLRNAFLEARAITEHGLMGKSTVEVETYSFIEDIFPEPIGDGIAARLDQLWGAFSDLADRPTSLPLRSQVLVEVEQVAGAFHLADQRLHALRDNAAERAEILSREVNTAAQTVADLNMHIVAARLGGMPTADLEDQRDLLAMRLADLTGAQVRTLENGSMTVSIGGSAIVSGPTARSLVVNDDGVNVSFTWDSPGGAPAVVPGGEIAGLAEATNNIVATYRGRLDNLASEVAAQVNAIHATGYGSDGVTGRNLFDPAGVTAATIAIDAAIVGNPAAVAAGGTSAPQDGDVARTLAALGEADNGPDAIFRDFIVTLGVEAGAAGRRAEMQQRVTADIDIARLAESGVNIDEELTGLVTAQHGYAAAARVITTVDEMLDTIINRLGVVGR